MIEIKNSAGFTLIELLIVSGIIVIISASAANLFFSSLKGATKTTVINEAKQNGDFALSIMERMVRNAGAVVTCSGASTSLSIKNPDGNTTTFQCLNNRIASSSGAIDNYLTSTKVVVSSCSFSCTQQTGTTALIKIYFTVSQLAPSPGVTLRPEETVGINYETSIVVRNSGG